MTRQEANQTVANLKATSVFTRVWEEAPEPWVNFTVYAKIENNRTGSYTLTTVHDPLTESQAKKIAREAKAKSKATDAKILAGFKADRENQR